MLTASDITFPINSVGSGLVEIEIDVDSAGRVKTLEVIRDVPSLTSAVLTAMGNWTFAHGEMNGKPELSSLFANVVFDPGISHPAQIPLSSELKEHLSAGNEFVAPRVSKAVYPDYPINSIAAGMVVLDVTVNKSGRVGAASPVYTVPSLTKPAKDAVKRWIFKPGTFRGTPSAASTVVAFVFRSPTISTPELRPAAQ